jgi:hypothetical protein
MAHAVGGPLVDQVAPPSVVPTIPPDWCAKHVVVLGQLILLNALWTTFVLSVTQVAPPSVVFNAVLQSPTARQSVALGQLTAARALIGVGLPADQLTPPSFVKRMIPEL